MEGEAQEIHKGLRVERDGDNQWYVALPQGAMVGAWQKVDYVDLINMGLTEDSLDKIPVGVSCSVRIDQAAVNEIHYEPRARSAEKAQPKKCYQAFWLMKNDEGKLYLGWGVDGAIYWHRIELRDLPYLGVDIRDVERMVPGENYAARIPRVRLEC